jgi:hypothetical protein
MAADFQTLSYGRDAHDSGRARTVSGLSIGVSHAHKQPFEKPQAQPC